MTSSFIIVIGQIKIDDDMNCIGSS